MRPGVLLLCLLLVLPARSFGATDGAPEGTSRSERPTPDCEQARRALVARAVKKETPVPSLTVLRDDESEFPLFADPDTPDLILYRVREGGLYQEESGQVVRVVVDSSLEWTVFFDPETNRIFRMSGFSTGNDFNEMIRTYGGEVDRTDALRLVDGYVGLVYSSRSRPVASLYELRRAVEDVLFEAGLDDAGISHHVRAWLDDERQPIEAALEARSLVSDGNGFRSHRVVVRVAGTRRRPAIEVRRLVLHVSRRGEVRVATDEVIAVLDLAAREKASR